jgi:hypothetical protein
MTRAATVAAFYRAAFVAVLAFLAFAVVML